MALFSRQQTQAGREAEEAREARAEFEKRAEYVSDKLDLDPGVVQRAFSDDKFSLKAYYNRLADARFSYNFFTATMLASGGAFLASFAGGPGVAARLALFTLGGAAISNLLRSSAKDKIGKIRSDIDERIKLLPKPDTKPEETPKPDDGLRFT